MKKVMSLLFVMCAVLLGACSTKTTTNNNTNPTTTNATTQNRGPKTTIKVAAQDSRMGYFDPEYKDPITGDFPIAGMDNFTRDAKRRAIAKIEDQFNVTFEFVTYPNLPEVDILTSVLAKDPIADLVHLDGQSKAKLIVPQNVLQDISDLAVVQAEENKWMMGKLAISDLILGFSDTPLGIEFSFLPMVFNIDLVESCPGAIAMGYPTDLWQKGEWTWDTLDKYFAELKICGDQADTKIYPYAVPDSALVQQAGGSNGGYVVDETNRVAILDWVQDENGHNGYTTTLDPAWGEAIDLAFNYRNTYGYTWSPVPWRDDMILPEFVEGRSYFAGLFPYEFAKATTELTKRGQSMALVPFPKGPRVLNGTAEHEYNFLSEGGDAFGVPKGVSQAKKELAVESYIALIKETYVQLGYVDDNGEFDFDLMKETQTRKYVTKYFDVDHPAIGEDMFEMYNVYYEASQYYNPLKSLVGLWDIFWYIPNAPQRHPNKEEEMRKRIWTGDGYNVPAQLKIDEPLAKILSGEDPQDTTAPLIAKVAEYSTTNIKVKATDNLTSQEFWKQFFIFTDNVTKNADLVIVFDLTNLNTEAPVDFELKVTATDAAGNTKTANYSIIVESATTTE